MKITDTKEFIKIVSILSLSDVHPADCTYITDFIIDLQRRIDLASKLLEQYIGILDDTADLYFKNVLSILRGEDNE